MTLRRRTDYIVVHCSATSPQSNIGADEIDDMHRRRGFDCIGYHAVIRRDGLVEFGRQFDQPGAHVKGQNYRSVGICLVGGVDEAGMAENNFTPQQFRSLHVVLLMMQKSYPGSVILGHRDLSPDTDGDGVVERHEWLKDCPCFDVQAWLASYDTLAA